MKHLAILTGLILVAVGGGVFGGMEYRAAQVPGAVVPVAIAGIPLSSIGSWLASLASGLAAAWLHRSKVAAALHSDPPPTISGGNSGRGTGRTVRSLNTGPGFSVSVEVDADRLGDQSFRAAVVEAVQSAISIPTPGPSPNQSLNQTPNQTTTPGPSTNGGPTK